jgi:hypothetical protein
MPSATPSTSPSESPEEKQQHCTLSEIGGDAATCNYLQFEEIG